ncbi:hypothetical protein BpHYR1_053914 [Brachionus plicatilis]|uniref:Secreted protein n=1 Tax=Brachionus plicatilis TaxID=10195 RepID=A0A3M7QBR2_BRAPC|nr:hypothetical protein BpHYR1_053914 [Brachionus plicatilis]
MSCSILFSSAFLRVFNSATARVTSISAAFSAFTTARRNGLRSSSISADMLHLERHLKFQNNAFCFLGLSDYVNKCSPNHVHSFDTFETNFSK